MAKILVTNNRTCIIHLLGTVAGAEPVSLIPGVAVPVDESHFNHPQMERMHKNGTITIGDLAKEAEDAGAVEVLRGRTPGKRTPDAVKAANPVIPDAPQGDGDEEAPAGDPAAPAAGGALKPWETGGKAKRA